jgi:hypothetical protein
VELAAPGAANPLASDDIAPGDRLRLGDRRLPPPVLAVAGHCTVDADRMLRRSARRDGVHVVAKGETLSASRASMRSSSTVLRLTGFGRGRGSRRAKIVVRRSGPRSHTVRRGDTLRISSRYGADAPKSPA